MSFVVDDSGKFPVKMWLSEEVEESAKVQLRNVSNMPFIYKHIAVMPDVHWGRGATIGSVIPTLGAIIPSAVGVDLGCGVIAASIEFRADSHSGFIPLKAQDLPTNLADLRELIEKAIPHGRTDHGGNNDKGAWGWDSPRVIGEVWKGLEDNFEKIKEKYPKIDIRNGRRQLASLGSGNHFCEVCRDETDTIWIMLHSGSRGIGNSIGSFFIELAKKDMSKHFIHLPDKDLSYLVEGSEYFNDYVAAVSLAQEYAKQNRNLMFGFAMESLHKFLGRPIQLQEAAINVHHNYISKENHFGQDVWITRKGATRARIGDLGIIPGSMGTKSYIVEGKGDVQSFTSCSHGAGRRMSRRAAKETFTLEDHRKATEGVECRKDKDVIDETPGAYKDIDGVIAAQSDLVNVKHTLRQIVCVKG